MSNVKISAQYIKDLSFEVPKSPEVFLNPVAKPNIELSIDIDAKKLSDTAYEIGLKIKANADEGNVFVLEIQYCGIFNIDNVEEEMVEQILLIYCPNLLFPFLRQIIANTTMNAGFAPLMLDPIDFTTLYQKRKESGDKAN